MMKKLFLTIAIMMIIMPIDCFLFKNLINKQNRNDENNNNNKCSLYVQDNLKYNKCTASSTKCRECCHFDLIKLNDLIEKNRKDYYLKQSVLVDQSMECLCEICKKDIEDFSNTPFFRR